MPSFTFTSPDGKNYTVNGPDGATPEQAFQILQQQIGSQSAKPSPVGAVEDFVKSMPRGAIGNIASAASYAGESPVPPPDELLATPDEKMGALDKNFGLHQPQTRAGRLGEALGGTLGNPMSYVGPGGAGLKLATAALSGGASEAAGQATEGTRLEGPARLAGALLGGVGAIKTAGVKAPQAVTPTADELFAAGRQGYKNAIKAGLELRPSGVGQFAAAAERDLTNDPELAFTRNSAPGTFGIIDQLQGAPKGATVSAANINQIRKDIDSIAGQVQPTAAPGVFKATPDAAAAMALKERFTNYLENLPQDHVLAGNPDAYMAAIKEANGNWAAASRLANVDARLTKAENAANRQIAGNKEAQIRSKVGSMLDNPQKLKGLTQEEVDQLKLINDGTFGHNILNQLGRGGAGVIPLGTHLTAAAMTGGASIPASLAIGAPLYAARKISQAVTTSRANKLADMLAQRSPLYEGRVNALPQVDMASNKASLARALLGVQ